MSHRAWPDGDDAIAAELRRALDEAQQRIPDDVTLRRGWAAIDTPALGRAARDAAVVVRGGMASTAALALACAAWLWPRVVQTPERGQGKQAAVARTRARHRRRRDG